MIGFVTGFGPEIPNEAFQTVERLEQKIRDCDRDLSRKKRGFSTIVVSVIVIDPNRGVIPNSISLKRFSRELWSTWNIVFADFLAANDSERETLLRQAACGAISALEGKFLDPIDIQTITSRISETARA